MLDLSQLQDQLQRATQSQSETRELRVRQVDRARTTLRAVGGEWEELQREVESAQPRRLVAALRSDPTTQRTAPDRPAEITVVATDGSQIYPDRHVEPAYFLLNVGRVAFHYGTTETPVLDAVPNLRFPDDLEAHFDEVLATMTTEVVSALRDEQELAELLHLAQEQQRDGRDLVALADGTLIRWMLRGMQNREVEQELIARYTQMLSGFMESALPVASYVSMPGNTEVVNLLRFHLDELDEDVDRWRSERRAERPSSQSNADPAPDRSAAGEHAGGDGMQVREDAAAYNADASGGDEVDEPPLSGLLDRHLFSGMLAPGERSAVFGSTSHIQREYPEGNEICYFYVQVPVTDAVQEIARVEIPAWVADDRRHVDLIHSVLLAECEKGSGYPLVLSEAHERAVIRAHERDAFQRLLDQTLRRAGVPTSGSRKRQSKRRPKV